MSSFLFPFSAYAFVAFMFLAFFAFTVLTVSAHTTMAKEMHGYKNDKGYYENPVFSNPFHGITPIRLLPYVLLILIPVTLFLMILSNLPSNLSTGILISVNVYIHMPIFYHLNKVAD